MLDNKKVIDQKFRQVLRSIYFVLRKKVLKSIFRQKAVEKIRVEQVTSIMAIRIDRIGDIVVSLPGLRALKDIFPSAHLAILVKPQNIPLLRDVPWIDELVPYCGFMKSVKSIRRRQFYMAVDFLMDYTLKNALISFFSRAPVKAGFDIEGRGRLFNLALKPHEEKKEMSRHLLDLVRLIGNASGIDENRIQDSSPELYLSEQLLYFRDEFLKRHAIRKGDILFGIHPGGYFPSQRWMPERFAELARRLSHKYNARIIIVGSYKEERLIKKVKALMETEPLLAVGFPLDRLASIISIMDILICNNSGPLHIAASLRIPTVSTMGPTVAELWLPQGKNHIVIRHDLPCRPCNRPSCKGHECMKSITVEEMEKAVDIQMERKR